MTRQPPPRHLVQGKRKGEALRFACGQLVAGTSDHVTVAIDAVTCSACAEAYLRSTGILPAGSWHPPPALRLIRGGAG